MPASDDDERTSRSSASGPAAGEDRFAGLGDASGWSNEVGRFAARHAQRAARWAAQRTGPYPVLVLTLLLGALTAIALTAASAEIYEAVAEADGAARLDHPVLDWAVSTRTTRLNMAVTAFTDLGGPVGMTILATIATAILAVWRRSWAPVVLMTAATCGSLAMTVVGKPLVGRIRPPLADAVAPYETSASFPSGHALNATVVAGVVAYLLVVGQRRLFARVLTVGAAVVFALLMGLSRVFLGHHWLTDVLMAWTLGLAWLIMIVMAHRLFLTIRTVRRRSAPPPTGQRAGSAS